MQQALWHKTKGRGGACRRVGAMVLRYFYLLGASWVRVAETIYWPTVQMILWGFTSQFLQSHSSWLAHGAGVLIGGVLLWDVLFRGNLGLSLSFMEEMWSRNLGNLFVTPLRPLELIAALVVMSLLRTVVGVTPAAVLAIVFYEFNIFAMGLPLLLFFLQLMVSGWSIGLVVSALVLRLGLGAESLAWVLVFALAPVSAIYYPMAALPGWLQSVATVLPMAHVFEGMRQVLFEGTLNGESMLYAMGLNVFYLAASVLFALRTFHVARKRGLFLNAGE
ncbi:MAG: ABC transporter permease [Rhodospirillaceae bacterium]|nr:MAG: ABC transporter permease [Rhodospirillaceae bacterium]